MSRSESNKYTGGTFLINQNKSQDQTWLELEASAGLEPWNRMAILSILTRPQQFPHNDYRAPDHYNSITMLYQLSYNAIEFGAGSEIRTRDDLHGKQAFYQTELYPQNARPG